MSDQPSLAPKKTLDVMLMTLDRSIRRFRIDFERFFSGNLPVPPEQLRISIINQLKELRVIHMKAVAHRFRFNTLEAKFNALLVLFNRRMREFELGKKGRKTMGTDGIEFDPVTGVIIKDRPTAAAAQALFHGLYDEDSGPKADFEKFQSYLHKQAEKIREKTGCTSVSFRVASEKGKLKLKAKAVKGD